MQQIKSIPFFNFYSYSQSTNLSLLSDVITFMLITIEWLIHTIFNLKKIHSRKQTVVNQIPKVIN